MLIRKKERDDVSEKLNVELEFNQVKKMKEIIKSYIYMVQSLDLP